MKMLTLSLLLIFVSCSRSRVKIPCDKDSNPCPKDKVCTLSLGGGTCQDIALEERPFRGILPFHGIQPILCKKGLTSTEDIYERDTSTFALLLTGLGELSAQKVLAMADGVAYTYDDCPTRDSSSKFTSQTTCGLGLGNHVRILHADGHLSVYAHLSEITIKNEEKVEQGQEIGIEGASGDTPKRGVRISVHRPWSPKILLTQPGQVGRSQPFLLYYRKTDEDLPTWRPSSEVMCSSNGMSKFIYGGKK